MVVEFLLPVRIEDIAPRIRAHGVVLGRHRALRRTAGVDGRERDVGAGPSAVFRVGEQCAQAVAIEPRALVAAPRVALQSAQVDQGGVDVDQRDGPAALARRARNARGADDQRNADALLPQRVLEEEVLLTMVVAVVAGEHDDRVVLERAAVDRVHDPADLLVDERDACEIGLQILLQTFLQRRVGLPEQAEVHRPLAVLRQVAAEERVVPVAGADHGKLHGLRGEHVVETLRRVERRVRADEAAGHEERLAVLLRREFADAPDEPAGDRLVGQRVAVVLAGVAIRLADHPVLLLAPLLEKPAAGAVGMGGHVGERRERAVDRTDAAERHRNGRVPRRVGAVRSVVVHRAVLGAHADLVPFLPVAVVHDLAGAEHAVAVVAEVRHHRFARRKDGVLVPVGEREVARRVGIDAREEAGARRCTDGVVAEGAGEQDARPRQPVDVRRARLRVPAEDADVVVQVVDHDEDDVRRRLRRRGHRCRKRRGRDPSRKCVSHGVGGRARALYFRYCETIQRVWRTTPIRMRTSARDIGPRLKARLKPSIM